MWRGAPASFDAFEFMGGQRVTTAIAMVYQ